MPYNDFFELLKLYYLLQLFNFIPIITTISIDEIGFVCSYIDNEGFIVPANVGGMDYRLFPAQQVVVHGKKDIPGIISSVPPHLSDGNGVISSASDLLIDTGYTKEQLEEDDAENMALEDFLSGFSFDDEEETQIEPESGFDEECYERIVNNDNIIFTKDELSCINKLLDSDYKNKVESIKEFRKNLY